MTECALVLLNGKPLFSALSNDCMAIGDEVSLKVSAPGSVSGKYTITGSYEDTGGRNIGLKGVGSPNYDSVHVALLGAQTDRPQRWKVLHEGSREHRRFMFLSVTGELENI